MRIDHIGYAVKRIDRAISSFEKLGFVFGGVVNDEDRNVKISFGEKDGYKIELVSPLNKSKESPVDVVLTNSTGSPYHICYRSDNLENDIKCLEEKGFKVIIEPKPAVAFGGRRVVFIMNLEMGLLEIVES